VGSRCVRLATATSGLVLADPVSLQGHQIRRGRSGVIRSSFVVDEKGKIEVAPYNVKATGHVDKLRRNLSI
jgi:peroxiredoxin